MKNRSLIIFMVLTVFTLKAQVKTKQIPVGKGWAKNSINTVIFRKNALTSHGDTQYVSYYDDQANVVLARRKFSERSWSVYKTKFTGNTDDAHNAISIAADAKNNLHLSWDHHDVALNYAVFHSDLKENHVSKRSMTGIEESKVSYPQFYNLIDGNLLFLYRSGQSGKGSLVVKHYNIEKAKWTDLHKSLIDGQGERNAYWQACIDRQGTVHLAWVWRESWDVSSNHDMCYARSKDGGKTWEKSTGEQYELPITANTAEYAWNIPQHRELINQTAISADGSGNPYIATYWTEKDRTNYQIIYNKDGAWKHENTNFRTSSFKLGGGGTKQIPVSRPELLVYDTQKSPMIYLLFRDLERKNRISLAYTKLNSGKPWEVIDLTKESVGAWEPNYDIELWKRENKLHIFMQEVTQIDGEGVADREATPVSVLEVSNLPKY